jgi:hypothetical protein
MSRRPPLSGLRMQASATLQALRMTGEVRLAALAADGKGLRKFHMSAYNGGPMRMPWAGVPVIVDLAGMDLTNKARPILKDHNPEHVVGHSEQIINDQKTLAVDGVVSGTGPEAKEVVANSDNGFPWQASIGCDCLAYEEIAAGVDVTVNGQTFTGPLLIVRSSRLGEVSFVALGADDSTTASMLAASLAQTSLKGSIMDFEAWLKSLGFDPAALSPEQTAVLQTAFDAKQAADAADSKKAADAPAKAAAAAAALMKACAEVAKLTAASVKPAAKKIDPAKVVTAQEEIDSRRALHAAESQRIGDIQTLCAGRHAVIEAKAIGEGWSKDKCELEVLRASRAQPQRFNIGTNQDGEMSGEVLEAAVCMSGRLKNVEKAFSERTLNAAQKQFKGRMSLGRLLLSAAQANGYTGMESLRENQRDVLRAAFAGQLQAAGFSTVDISGILSNIANKYLLQGFMAVEDAWRKIAAIRSVSDFKTITSYRMTGANQYKKVGPGGQIEHGTLGNDTFTNKADTYGIMLGITRQDQINDDLGALTKVPEVIGRGGALKLNEVFWLEFLNNAAFFSAGNKNLSTGTPASLLTIDGLTNARTKFRKQKDQDGKPIGVIPAIVLVPPELEVAGDVILNSLEVRDSTASTKAGVSNPHKGKYELVVSDYLSNDQMTGFSTTAHYMLAEPADLAAIEVAFLNGNESPTVESAAADFNTLGIQIRGYHDFGVAKQEFRAGVRSNGA